MSRMDRYSSANALEDAPLSRVKKNDSLYEDIKTSELTRVRTNNNMRILESNGKTINIDKIRKYLEEKDDEPRSKRNVILPEAKKEKEEVKNEETREYDINSVLEKAKKAREIDYEIERYKKLRDTQYDILSKIKMYEEEAREETKDEEIDLNTEERTLVDLINTITIHKGDENLLGDLMGGKTEEITLPIDKEKENGSLKNDILKEIEDVNDKKEKELEKTRELVNLKEKTSELDKSFFTNSMTFSKEDFEGFEELEKNVKKNNALTKIMLGILVVFIIATLAFILNYVFNLGLF